MTMHRPEWTIARNSLELQVEIEIHARARETILDFGEKGNIIFTSMTAVDVFQLTYFG